MKLLTVCCFASLALFAQNTEKNLIPRPPIPRPPIIIEPITIKLPPEVQAQPIEVRDVDIRAAVNGVHAETTMTITFYNPNPRVLEGELYFPLPTDATVSGYALDINGVLVDGVIVEKEKARVVFEELVRQGIDPGLVEQSAGNVFKTRIYPLRANATRQIRVKYVSKVDIVKEGNDYATYYKQPLRFEKPLRSFKLRIEVAAAQKAPKVREGKFSNLSFGSWQNLYVAETELKDIALSEDLNVSIMTAPLQSAVAEKAADGNCYFAVDALIETSAATAKEAPSIVLWDASASRDKTDHDAELAFLEKILPQKQQLTLIAFRDKPLQPATFNSPKALVDAIRQIPFDGASNIAAAIAATPVNANVILCSDGLDNFGPDLKTVDFAQRQINAIFQDRDQNITSLRRLSQKAGGQVIDLRTLGLDEAIATFNAPGLAVSAIFLDGKDIANECQSRLESGKLAVAGLLPEGAHKLDVIIKSAGKQQTLSFNLNTADAPKGSLLRTNYGQMLIASLIADNAAEDTVTAAGKQFGLVTPNTSLLVLDTLEQYVRYRVRPPESLPDMRKQYDERIASEGKADKPESGQLVPNDMNHVKQIWNALVDWHKKRNFAAVGATKEYMEAAVDGAAPAERPGILRRAMNAIAPSRSVRRSVENDGAVYATAAAPAPMAMADGAAVEAREEAAPALAKQAAEPSARPAAKTSIQAWTPSAPYLDDLRKAAKGKAYEMYLTLRKTFGDAPGFYMDCADFFATELKDKATAVTVLSNLAELELENRQVLRILGYKLRFFGELESAEQ
ncbi:MAG: VIT and VWA domain-containing protein, partial [Lentisphaeria bacterium]|nr:VIT and VWA domain-containing protein [Lentisphaeria bacterium]